MTKHLTRKVNGQPETVVVSDAKAGKLIAKGWELVKAKKPAKVEKPKVLTLKPKKNED